MRVIPFGHSVITWQAFDVMNEVGFVNDANNIHSGDLIPEFAGRGCYVAYNKPNPATATNQTYLKNILNIGHESVLEHSSVTFYCDGISRNLLLELERHRHVSLSVLSTRYVSEEKFGNVIHPSVPERWHQDIEDLDSAGRDLYNAIYDDLKEEGKSTKQAREAARSVLLGSTETKFLVTANIRAWRYIINLRNADGADVEIREFAQKVLERLKQIVPNSVQDM
jgi:thymidylate synthase (FAD)